MLGHGLLGDLDISLCDEVVVGLITCEGVLLGQGALRFAGEFAVLSDATCSNSECILVVESICRPWLSRPLRFLRVPELLGTLLSWVVVAQWFLRASRVAMDVLWHAFDPYHPLVTRRGYHPMRTSNPPIVFAQCC